VAVSDNNDGSYSVEVLRDASSGAPSVNLSVVGTTVSVSVDLPPGSRATPALSGRMLVGLAGLVGILGAWLLQSRRRARSRAA